MESIIIGIVQDLHPLICFKWQENPMKYIVKHLMKQFKKQISIEFICVRLFYAWKTFKYYQDYTKE